MTLGLGPGDIRRSLHCPFDNALPCLPHVQTLASIASSFVYRHPLSSVPPLLLLLLPLPACSQIVHPIRSFLSAKSLVVGTSLAVVANELEAANHLANDDTASGELGRANVAGALEKALCGLATERAG